MKKTPAFLALLFVLCAGCTHTHVILPDKTEIERTSFLTNPTIGPVDIQRAGDTTTFKMGGYSHEQLAAVKQALDLATGLAK